MLGLTGCNVSSASLARSCPMAHSCNSTALQLRQLPRTNTPHSQHQQELEGIRLLLDRATRLRWRPAPPVQSGPTST